MTLVLDLAHPCPTVRVDGDAQEAAWLLVRERLPALLVLDQVECPYAIVPAAQLPTAPVPEHDRQDLLPALIGDRFDDDVRGVLSGRPVADWLPRRTLLGAITADVLSEHFIGGP
ncbi:hypothetical protein OG241_19830 [Streptomyces sp. NBC_01390]|uniref:hypothetical protein n=1 Tax=Streptomyces sp. NBC_01390 TaxID=2903850 RepID=UPI0032468BCE